MFCSNCGSVIDDNAKFCGSCGAPVEQPAPKASESYTYDQPASAYPTPAAAPAVGFVDAIRLFFSRYIEFSGRSRRSEYWFAVLFVGLVNGLLNAIFGDSSFLGSLWSLATLIPGLAVAVRRLHDADKSGLNLLWLLLPVIGWIILLIPLCADSAPDNEFGPNPKRQ